MHAGESTLLGTHITHTQPHIHNHTYTTTHTQPHIHNHTYTITHTQTHIHNNTYTAPHTSIHTYTHILTHTTTHTYITTYTHTHTGDITHHWHHTQNASPTGLYLLCEKTFLNHVLESVRVICVLRVDEESHGVEVFTKDQQSIAQFDF